MAKPILTIRQNKHFSSDEYKSLTDMITDMTNNEYYIFILHGKSEETTIEVFYEKDFNEVKYKELKKIILDSLN